MKSRLFFAALLSAMTAQAGDITPGYTFQDGHRIYATELQQLVNNAIINPYFYTSKGTGGTNLQLSDIILISSAGTFYKKTGADILENPLLVSAQAPYTSLAFYDSFLLYDPTNGNLGQITLSNLSKSVSSYLVASNIVYSSTNGNLLPKYGTIDAGSTNNQLNFVVYDTNGVSSYTTLSNLLAQIEPYQYTNNLMPYVWRQIYAPWGLYGTNTATPYTNAWGYTTNFPITALHIGTNQTATLVDSDTIPVNSSGQGTNTTATLDSVYSYLTNRNTLPAYTQARIQFMANVMTLTVSNIGSAAIGAFQIQSNVFTAGSIYCVSFNTNAALINANITNNAPYFIIPKASNQWVSVFSNYSAAVSGGTNWMPIANESALGTSIKMYYVTNYTSFNADVTAASLNNAVANPPNGYDIWFRTNSANANYYVSGMVQQQIGNHGGWLVMLSGDNIIQTNRFRVEIDGLGGSASPATSVHLLVQPQ